MNEYYEEVGAYYDIDVGAGFEAKGKENKSLNRIRESFRSFVSDYPVRNLLEIGCGPGFDLKWAAEVFPEAQILGIDVSEQMVESARTNMESYPKVSVQMHNEHNLGKLEQAPFDTVVVFFGALNTVENLDTAANEIFESLRPGGRAVLTFVNKWYLRELLVNLIKVNFKTAFARIQKFWGGYSTNRYLASRCYSPGQIRSSFSAFNEKVHHGYSIIYPAWYNDHKVKNDPIKREQLWAIDQRLNKTPFWKFGEYTLFVFEKPV